MSVSINQYAKMKGRKKGIIDFKSFEMLFKI